MATLTVVDYRRTDLRTNVLHNPYWISSAEMVGADCEDKVGIAFSFPTAGLVTLVMAVYLQITVGFTANTTINVGSHTLATDVVTTGGVATTVDVDDYLPTADISDVTAAGLIQAATGDWVTAVAAGTGAVLYIVGAATTVPAVGVAFANAGTIAAGKCRVHMLVTQIPSV